MVSAYLVQLHSWIKKQKMETFKIEGEYIELIALLKVTGIAETGGVAGILVTQGEVMVDGVIELRKRAKLRPGMKVKVGEQEIVLE
jgi:ribosome-associated protein